MAIKILQIIPNLFQGGAERLVLDICIELQKRSDISVKLVTFSNDNLYPSLSKEVDWEVVKVKGSISILRKRTLNVKPLQKIIEDYSPDVIHSHLFIAELYSHFCFYPKAKWFSHVHDNMEQLKAFTLRTLLSKKSLTNFFERCILQRQYNLNGGTTYISISKHSDKYIEKHLPKYNRALLHNAISFNKFYIQRQRTSLTALRIVNVGSLVTKKNQLLLLKVVKKLIQEKVDVSLVLVGDGVERKNLEDYAIKNQIERHVKFIGNTENVSGYLETANVYVHSAIYEPFGLVLLEAMASGLPVISLDGGGNSDILKNRENGFLIQENNEDLFVRQLKELMSDDHLYHLISQNGQNFARQFDISKYVDQLLDIYQK